jgi:hypothetical protein
MLTVCKTVCDQIKLDKILLDFSVRNIKEIVLTFIKFVFFLMTKC